MIKAIETEYNGYKFRSRLEARWAVFFDVANIAYEYEPEGFEFSNGLRYLPDFRLTEINIWVEVKGPQISNDWNKIQTAAIELPNYGKTRVEKYHEASLLLLGNIPDPALGVPSFPLLDCYGYYSLASFSSKGRFDDADGPIYGPGLVPDGDIKELPSEVTTEFLSNTWSKSNTSKYYDAFKSARQARFEHGQKGTT